MMFPSFLALSALIIMTPGPDTAITIRNAIAGGRGAGLATAFGISLGQLIWALATSLGIVALLVASEPLFLAIKYLGAAYLVYLGLTALWHAVRPGDPTPGVKVGGERPSRGGWVSARQGLLSNLGNPKMAVFFASLLPQFVPAGMPLFTTMMMLGTLFSAMTFGWLGLYVLAIVRAKRWLQKSGIRRTLDAVMGTMLVGLGLRIATEQR